MSTILVTGAAGKTGREVVKALANRGSDIRTFIRRGEAVEELENLGANDHRLGDLFDDESLRSAIEGCQQVIHICPPMHPAETALAQRITDLCAQQGVQRLVLYSVLHPLLDDVFHHNNKLEAERYLINSGLNYTILQPSRYMQHLTPIWKKVIESGVHDMPFSIDARFSVVDLPDVAEAAATVITEPGHEMATYQLAGPDALSQNNMAATISSVTGTTIRAEAKTEAAFRETATAAGMPTERIEKMCIMNRHYDAHGLLGNPNVLRWLLGREPNNFETYIRREFVD